MSQVKTMAESGGGWNAAMREGMDTVAGPGNEETHAGGKYVEDTEGEVHQSGDAENR